MPNPGLLSRFPQAQGLLSRVGAGLHGSLDAPLSQASARMQKYRSFMEGQNRLAWHQALTLSSNPFKPLKPSEAMNIAKSMMGHEAEVHAMEQQDKTVQLLEQLTFHMAANRLGQSSEFQADSFYANGDPDGGTGPVQLQYAFPVVTAQAQLIVEDERGRRVHTAPVSGAKGRTKYMFTPVDEQGAPLQAGVYNFYVEGTDEQNEAVQASTFVMLEPVRVSLNDAGEVIWETEYGQKFPFAALKAAMRP